MPIPERLIIHVSGIPATGKSTFCRYLAKIHGFAHYDMECFPRGWPHPDLYAAWSSSPQEFVRELERHHKRSVIDWGFPIQARHMVDELQSAGVELIWFAGDLRRARETFVERGGIDVSLFDEQVAQIQGARLPNGLGARVVDALGAAGDYRNCEDLLREIFSDSA